MADLAHSPQILRMQRKRRRACLAVGAAIVALVSSMGCLNLQFGGKSSTTEDPSVVPQTSSITIPKGQELTVYYPKPYASPPNLELDNSSQNCKIIEQRADHFRVRNDGTTLEVKWTARGVPMQAAVVVAPTTPGVTTGANP